MDGGWIKISRRMLDWEWYGDGYAVRVFLHLLLTCHPKAWRHCGELHPAGSLITSSRRLAETLGLDYKTVQGVFRRLSETGEIKVTPMATKGTLVEICHWRKYQTNDSESNVPSDVPSDVPSAVPSDVPSPPTPPNKVVDITIPQEGEKRVPAQAPAPAPEQAHTHNGREASLPRPPSSPDEVLAAARLAGDAKATLDDCKAFCDYYESQGWRKANGLAVVSWRGAFAEWMRRKNEQKKEINHDTDYANIRGSHYVSTDFSDYETEL